METFFVSLIVHYEGLDRSVALVPRGRNQFVRSSAADFALKCVVDYDQIAEFVVRSDNSVLQICCC